jgi:hypothetical protein
MAVILATWEAENEVPSQPGKIVCEIPSPKNNQRKNGIEVWLKLQNTSMKLSVQTPVVPNKRTHTQNPML